MAQSPYLDVVGQIDTTLSCERQAMLRDAFYALEDSRLPCGASDVVIIAGLIDCDIPDDLCVDYVVRFQVLLAAHRAAGLHLPDEDLR